MKNLYSIAITILLLASSATAQTIPNGSFENWGSDGNPVGWTTNNAVPLFTLVSRSNMSSEGSFSAQGTVVEVIPGQTAPPLLISGAMEAPGIPMNSRPGALNGFLAADLKGGDNVYITVSLMKDQQPVGGNSLVIATSSASFVPFSLPLIYIDGTTPDTAIIMVTVGNDASPTAGSSFTIDGLAFSAGSAAVDQPTEAEELNIVDRGRYHEVSFELNSACYVTLDVFDIGGRSVATLFQGVSATGRVNWDAGALPSGLYLCRLSSEHGVAIRKISIVR